MTTFAQTISPTPFGFFDSDSAFQTEADGMVIFVKRKLGGDTLSVELTKKEIWSCFEEAALEYSRQIHEMRMKSDLVNVLGLPTSSNMTSVHPRQTLEFLLRLAEPYASIAGTGGSYDSTLCYFDIETGRQDYNIYTELKVASGSNSGQIFADTLPVGSRGKIRILELFHVEPLAAQHFLLNASNITNFLATSFNYESYVNSTVFYVLPVFEDVLRRGMLETAHRVRRSRHSYKILGSSLRIFPIPNSQQGAPSKLFLQVSAGQQNPLIASGSTGISYTDDSLNGITSPADAPFDNIPFSAIRQPGRQWIRQYTFALARELVGLIRSKLDTIPIPNAEVKLNGSELVQQAREDKQRLIDQLREFLADMTKEKMVEREAALAENVQKQLKYIPMPVGKSIIIG